MKIIEPAKRSKNYFNQVKGSIVFKAVAILASYLSVPLLIKNLGPDVFGIWSTLLGILTWIIFFDMGLGGGLQTKVAELIPNRRFKRAKLYISSGYMLLTYLALSIWIIFFTASFYISWQSIFNTTLVSENTLRVTTQICFSFVLVNFILGLTNAIAGAMQRSAFVVLSQMITSLLILLFIYLMNAVQNQSLILLSFFYGISIVIGSGILTLWFYSTNQKLTPNFLPLKKIQTGIMNIGLKFFIINLSVITIYTTDKILIAQFFGPLQVAQYDITMKVFSITLVAHSLINMPLWAAFADAYTRKNLPWIKAARRNQIIFCGVLCLIIIVIAFLFKDIIEIWIGEFYIEASLIIMVAIYTFLNIWNNVHAVFINATGKLNSQFYCAILSIFLNIPLTVIFIKYFSLGVEGVVLASILCLLIPGIVLPISSELIIKNKLLNIKI